MKLGIDLDGVVYPFDEAFRHYVTTYRGFDPARCTAPKRWSFYEDWGLTTAEFMELLAAGVDEDVIFTWGDPYPGAKESLERLKAAGHSLHVITDRTVGSPGVAQYATVAWLAVHGIPYDTITFAADKTIANVQAHVDDKIENYLAMDKVGCWAFLLTRPWNTTPLGDYYWRVTGLPDFAEKVLSR